MWWINVSLKLLLFHLVLDDSNGFIIPGAGGPGVESIRIRSALKCQLLGMSCARPTDFAFSFQGFCQRGGATDVHSDGWGLAFYDGDGLRQFHGTEAASESPIAQFLGTLQIQTLNMMAHVRYATQGEVHLANVHPFSRELWGINCSFCHNGDIPLFKNKRLPWIGNVEGEQIYLPVGDTDSEAMLCAVLNALRAKFKTAPPLPILHETLKALFKEIVDHSPDETILNCLFSCGPHTLFAYSWPGSRPGSSVWNGLHYTVREFPFGTCHLCDMDYQVDFSQVTSEEDRVAVIATKPLTTDEEWVEFERNELIMFDEGIPHRTAMELLDGEKLELTSEVIEEPSLDEDIRRYRFKKSFFIEGSGI
mmetsp:Transcript_39167/g.55131  ORF Transcript_39167/g.55131 Transcript_39167/m.55131 type:complete len:364 (-) Transcript_39167:339-1430(-)